MVTDDNRIEFVINNFTSLEKRLSECMEFIPFVGQNKCVVSSKFIPMILESCGLIESILREITKDKSRRYSFKDYAKLHEANLELDETISIFLVSPIKFYQPYKRWTEVIPEWWGCYNKLKHDRLNNYEFATYETAILSLVGLHQLISKCRLFTDHIIKAGWFNPSGEFMPELVCARISESGIPLSTIPCESNLFVSPLNFNFVSFQDGVPVIEECDFSDRVKLLLTMSGY
ncbi:MAG: hypothetical protein NTW48_03770 [Chloroflexi bacterium]|nr:hypothetical protein [Chloroflexota bacterium]